MTMHFRKALIDLSQRLEQERDLASRCKNALRLIVGYADEGSSLQRFAQQAQDRIHSLPKADRAHLEAIYSIGHECFALGQFSEATDLFVLISTFDPNSEVAYHSLGITEQERGHYDAAAQAYQVVSLLAPSASVPALLYATECHIMKQDYAKAIGTLQQAKELMSPQLQPSDWKRAAQLSAYLESWEA
ncbi:MAG: hypothetical protein KDK78_00940 [Chlamydiia bacterium]|nr:hypothetical protein [Chlamydiia bacterium]